MQILFWISLFIVFYTYIGYGILLFLIVKCLRFFRKPKLLDASYELPSVTVIVAAYNESYCIEEKIKNTLSLDYPTRLVLYLLQMVLLMKPRILLHDILLSD
jgi:cellulose synthase/poly-beta-1,6-N-acetylglucosamine synthase-like glycosyltransferase